MGARLTNRERGEFIHISEDMQAIIVHLKNLLLQALKHVNAAEYT